MTKFRVGPLRFTAARTEVGGLLVTFTRHTRSLQIHTRVLHHRPPETR